jgi:pimeloyl-ACP methyl ester carboxylesterase
MHSTRLSLPFLNLELETICWQPECRQTSQRSLLLLHEGLGSVAMWRQFGQILANRCGMKVLAYSREGYGKSCALQMPRTPQFMHREAHLVLPALLNALKLEDCILLGHSDGASIALLAAPQLPQVKAVVSMAAHVFVEAITVESIREALRLYEDPDSGFRARLARYHADVDGAFYGWTDVWLSADFLHWNIEEDIAGSPCPVLAIQGEQDQYGTMKQLQCIARALPQTQLLALPNCQHSPHLEQAERVLEEIVKVCVRA